LGFQIPLQQTAEIDYRADVGSGLIEHERVSVFAGLANEAELAATLNPEEVAAIRWIEVSKLASLVQEEGDTICPWFAIYINRWAELNLPV
jgi:isopentenyl-diphosphate delta-isomerase